MYHSHLIHPFPFVYLILHHAHRYAMRFVHIRVVSYCHERFWSLIDSGEAFLPWVSCVVRQTWDALLIVHHSYGDGIEFGTWQIALLFGCSDSRVNRLEDLRGGIARHSHPHVWIHFVELVAQTAHEFTITVIRLVVSTHVHRNNRCCVPVIPQTPVRLNNRQVFWLVLVQAASSQIIIQWPNQLKIDNWQLKIASITNYSLTLNKLKQVPNYLFTFEGERHVNC